MKTVYVYLHGFNSAYSADNPKIKELEKIGTVVGISYNSYGSYDEIFSYLLKGIDYILEANDHVILVGTSLGGFWAYHLAEYCGLPSILINPCVDPFNMLKVHLDKRYVNYVTGEEKVLDSYSLSTYENMSISNDTRQPYLPLVLLDADDDVIDSYETAEYLSSFLVHMFPGGSHRFDHMEEAMNLIQEYANNLSYVEDLDI